MAAYLRRLLLRLALGVRSIAFDASPGARERRDARGITFEVVNRRDTLGIKLDELYHQRYTPDHPVR